jgi:hypothetical protein
MLPEALGKDGLEKLDDLTLALTSALDASPTPHLTAASVSWLDDDGSGSLTGGDLTAPSSPPFVCDHNALISKHRALLECGLYGVVARAERPNAHTPWHVRVQLISRDERRELEAKRKPLDQAIESELRRFGQGTQWKRSSFGRSSRTRPPLVIIADPAVRKLEPTPRLMDLLVQVVSIYASFGLTLVTATWTLRTSGLDVMDYFE